MRRPKRKLVVRGQLLVVAAPNDPTTGQVRHGVELWTPEKIYGCPRGGWHYGIVIDDTFADEGLVLAEVVSGVGYAPVQLDEIPPVIMTRRETNSAARAYVCAMRPTHSS